MGRSFYVVETRKGEGWLIVSGYPEGVIPSEFLFTSVRRINLVHGEQVIQNEPQTAPQAVMLRVVKILSYDQELAELSELTGGHLMLEGEGIDLIERGMQLFE